MCIGAHGTHVHILVRVARMCISASSCMCLCVCKVHARVCACAIPAYMGIDVFDQLTEFACLFDRLYEAVFTSLRHFLGTGNSQSRAV